MPNPDCPTCRGLGGYPKCQDCQNAGGSAAAAGSGIPVVIDPDYSAFIVRARIIAKQEGYALAIHGSTTRDLDLIAVPWTKDARSPQALTARIDFNTGWRRQRSNGTKCDIGEKVDPTVREHGRLVWTFLPDGFADPRFVDFSVIPPNAPNPATGSTPEDHAQS